MNTFNSIQGCLMKTASPFKKLVLIFTFVIDMAVVIFLSTTCLAVVQPVITDVTPLTGTPVTITGTGFDQGGTYVWITEKNDWATPGVKVRQQIVGPHGVTSTTSIEIVINDCGLYPVISGNGNKAYLWVEDPGGHTATGYEVVITSYSDSTYPMPHSSLTVFPYMQLAPDTGPDYVSGTLTSIKDSFQDLESPITDCEYTIDGGLTWNTAYSEGIGDAARCSTFVIDTGADGTSLTIAMRALSCGGWSIINPDSARTLHRTVDTTGPLSGSSFNVTPGVGKCSLAWSATTDSASGMNTTDPYYVTAQADVPPTDCTSYSQRIYSGTDTFVDHTNLNPGKTYFYKLCYKDAVSNMSEYSDNPIACILNGISIEDGVTPPTTGWIKKSAVNYAVSTFTLTSHPSPNTITELIVTGTNTDNISTVKIFKDNGTTANDFDSNDTLIASTTFSGTEAVFSGLNISVPTTAEQYIVTFDTIATPTMLETVTAYVSAGTGDFPVVSYDTPDTTPKIDSQDPVTVPVFTIPSAWQSEEYTIELHRGDGSGSGFPPLNTSLWGCYGSGCTPALLTTGFMTTTCGDGNACIYDVRYYSMDLAGNVEQVKTHATQVKIDRFLPSGGTFSAYENSNPIFLEWSGITDTGSGISAFKIMRANGPTPPVDCTTGTHYNVSGSSYSDTGVTSGQQYSYRLCAYDNAGNVSSDYVATVTAGEPCYPGIMCDSCHGSTAIMVGGSKIAPPRGHTLHGQGCGTCHSEGGDASHVNGIVTIRSDIGYQGWDFPWPGVGIGTCGGTWNPIGCHTGGTPSNPGLTPEWVCQWEDSPMCTSPDNPPF